MTAIFQLSYPTFSSLPEKESKISILLNFSYQVFNKVKFIPSWESPVRKKNLFFVG